MRMISILVSGVFLALMSGHPMRADCPKPLVDNGIVHTSQGNKHTSKAEVRCKEDYTWVGPALSMCDSTGQWDPPLSKCYAKCKWPDITNSENTPLADLLDHGYAYHVICRERFTIPNRGVIKCQNGQWVWKDKSDQDITCTAHCPEPQALVTNGLVETDKGTSVYSIANIKCNEGYTCDGSNKVMCSNEGIWTPELPKCAAHCREPDIPHFTPWPGTCTYKHNHLFVMTCDEGYRVAHHGLLRCLNGEWTWALVEDSNEEIQCNPIACTAPFIPHRLSVEGPEPAVHGNVVKVVCEKGYHIDHGGFIRCHRGDWVWDDSAFTYTEVIQCKKDRDACPNSAHVPDAPHGQISHETQASSLKYQFNYGLHLMAGFAFLYLRYCGQNPTFHKWFLYFLTTQVIIFYCNQAPYLWVPWGV